MKTALLVLLGLAAFIHAVSGRACDTEPQTDCSKAEQKHDDYITGHMHCCKDGEAIQVVTSSVNSVLFFQCTCTPGSGSVGFYKGVDASKSFCEDNPDSIIC